MASTPVASGLWRAVVTIAFTANAAAERRMAPTLCGSVIWSSTSTMPSSCKSSMSGEGRGSASASRPWCTASGDEQPVDVLGPDDLGGDAGLDVVVRKPLCGVLGQRQLADLALRVGERHGHGVPAIEDDGPVGLRIAVAPGRPTGRFPCSVEGLSPAAGAPRGEFFDPSWARLCHGSRNMAIWVPSRAILAVRLG